MTPKAFFHFIHSAWILCMTSSSIFPLLCKIDPRYQKLDIFSITCYSIFTSKLLFVCILLSLHLLKQKSFNSKVSLHISNLQLTSSCDFFIKIISSTKTIHFNIASWICLVSISNTKEKRYGLKDNPWCKLIFMGKSTVMPS